MDKIFHYHKFFGSAEGKVRLQMASPETRYAWHNMSRFYKGAQVLRDGPVKEFSVEINDKIGDIAFTTYDHGEETVKSHLEKYPVDGFIVVKDGIIVFEHYAEGVFRPIDKHIWFSCSKIIGSTIFAILEAQGKVDKQKMVSEYLTELKGTDWDTIPLYAVLDMATGMNGTEHDEPEGELAGRTIPTKIWFRWAVTLGLLAPPADMPQDQQDRMKAQSPIDVIKEMKKIKEPMTVFEYNSINTWIMNRIVEKTLDKPLAEALSKAVWQQAGMEHDGLFLTSDQGYTNGFMGMNSTLRDFSRFGMIYTPSIAKYAPNEIVPTAVLDQLQKGGDPSIYGGGMMGKKFSKEFPNEPKITNHYQWDAIFEDGDMFKSGVGGQVLYVSPARNMVVCAFCTSDGYNHESTMARAICKALVPL